MSEQYSTVRIDTDSKEKLEEIAKKMSSGTGIKVSKAAALKFIVEEAYENQNSLPMKMFERMTKNRDR